MGKREGKGGEGREREASEGEYMPVGRMPEGEQWKKGKRREGIKGRKDRKEGRGRGKERD